MQQVAQAQSHTVIHRGDPAFEKTCIAPRGKQRVVKINYCDDHPEIYTILGDKNSLEEARHLLREYWNDKDMANCCTIRIFDSGGEKIWDSAKEATYYL